MTQASELLKTILISKLRMLGFLFCPLGDLDRQNSQTPGSSPDLSFFQLAMLFASYCLNSPTRIDQHTCQS